MTLTDPISLSAAMQDWIAAVPLMEQGYHQQLLNKAAEARQSVTVYPTQDRVLYALEATPLDQVEVVILGQDPYHGEGQAHGLAFSVPEGIPPPPSLRNIFKEIQAECYDGRKMAFSTDLSRWAEQGVLLLNTTLTVEAGRAASHANWGWQRLTDQIVEAVSRKRDHVVFMLWGNHARSKATLIDQQRHLVLESVHPSPLSAKRGFFGCGHFAEANRYLTEHKQRPIQW